MLSKILFFLFRNNDYPYIAHPAQVLWAILIMAMGTITFIRDGWAWFGFFSFAIGLGLAITIILAILWDKSIKYWETINENLSIALKLNDPNLKWEILAKLGYKEPQENVTVIETRQQTNDDGWQQKIYNLPVSPAVMQQVSNKVLMSKDLTFSETKYKGIVPKFRQVSKQWKRDGILAANNTKNPRLGFSFTRKGLGIIYQYADNAIKLLAEEKKDENRTGD